MEGCVVWRWVCWRDGDGSFVGGKMGLLLMGVGVGNRSILYLCPCRLLGVAIATPILGRGGGGRGFLVF